MNTNAASWKDVLFKWVSGCLLLAFVYYWLFTLSLVFFNRSTHAAAPRQSSLYASFFNQNWRLFAVTRNHSNELNFVVRTVGRLSETDTIPLVSYSMAKKKQYAPFNNYEDALERLLFLAMNDLENAAEKKKALVQKQFPGNNEMFYVQQGSMLVENNRYNQSTIKNLENYGKYVVRQQHADTSGKEFQLIFVQHYILPAIAPFVPADKSNNDTIFISTYKPL
jgi:hypothetical protein